MLVLIALALIIIAVIALAVVTDRRRTSAGGPNALAADFDPAASANISAEVLTTSERTA